jgi:hypothetical protein
MTVLTKDEALHVIRRAYGPDVAKTLAKRLPDSIDLDDADHAELLSSLGLTRDRIFSALGGEL